MKKFLSLIILVMLLLTAVDLPTLKRQLYDEYSIEVPIFRWNGLPLIRVSIQGYNDQADADRLLSALKSLLPASA